MSDVSSYTASARGTGVSSKSALFLTVLLSCMLLIPAGPRVLALGGTTAPESGNPLNAISPPPAEVSFSGVVILRIRTSAGGFDQYQRAAEILRRLNNALFAYCRKVEEARVEIRMVRGIPVIYVEEFPIVTVDLQSAKLNHSSQESLARVWADNLQKALKVAAVNRVFESVTEAPHKGAFNCV